jgi:predicted transcriptional regulator YheO
MEIKPLLKPYVVITDMLTKTFGQECEIVLHDLSIPERSVVYVANNSVTRRQVGQSFDQLVKQVILSNDLKQDFVANYFFTAPNGKLIRSSTLLIRDEVGKLAGAMCINLDTTRIQSQMDYLRGGLPPESGAEDRSPTHAQPEHIADMVTGIISSIIGEQPPEQMTREERLAKVRFMEEKGIFLMKGSIELAAARLGVKEVTIYSYLDELRRRKQ